MSEFVFTVPIGAASLNQTGASSSAPTPKVRTRPYRKACVHCHGRKVKCDKQSPCSNCQKLLLECSFPSPFRTSSRQAKEKAAEKGKEPDAALLDRIKQLEVAVQDLGALKKEVMRSRKRRKGQSSEDSDDDADGRSDDEEGRDHSSEAGPADDTGREIGKLIVEEGKSRYISGGFWGSLEDEDVCQMFFLACAVNQTMANPPYRIKTCR
jgi:Fungal Zn(2)-Cys(6) binuclear cluster domain